MVGYGATEQVPYVWQLTYALLSEFDQASKVGYGRGAEIARVAAFRVEQSHG